MFCIVGSMVCCFSVVDSRLSCLCLRVFPLVGCILVYALPWGCLCT